MLLGSNSLADARYYAGQSRPEDSGSPFPAVCLKVDVCAPCSCSGPRAASTARWPASGRPAPAWRRLLPGPDCPSRGAWRAHPAAGSRVAESTLATASARPGSGSLRPVRENWVRNELGDGEWCASWDLHFLLRQPWLRVASFGAATNFFSNFGISRCRAAFNASQFQRVTDPMIGSPGSTWFVRLSQLRAAYA